MYKYTPYSSFFKCSKCDSGQCCF